VLERDGKSLPGTMDYRQERRNLGIRDGKVIWVRRGWRPCDDCVTGIVDVARSARVCHEARRGRARTAA